MTRLGCLCVAVAVWAVFQTGPMPFGWQALVALCALALTVVPFVIAIIDDAEEEWP